MMKSKEKNKTTVRGMKIWLRRFVGVSGLMVCAGFWSYMAAAPRDQVIVHWDSVVRVSKTTPTLQVVVNPPLRRGSKIHDRVFRALKNLQADYVRYVPWHPYPKLAVAELEPPKDGKTSWDFSLIDPLTIDFLKATEGHPAVLDFSTTPQWMWVTPKPVSYPADPDQVSWGYEQGTELRDPSMKELADYYARLVGWYTAGGFRDEYGKWRRSDHHFKIGYWEVFNEPAAEHRMTPQQYTARYDAIVAAVKKVAPRMKFVGLSLSKLWRAPQWFEYFLNHKNHRPGTPLDMISYHFYARPSPDEPPEVHQFTFFEQADHFLDVVRYIESIRKRLSPATRTTLDEVGSILPNENTPSAGPIPNSYWNLSGAMYAYLYGRLAKLGIDVVGESQLVGYPTQYPSVSMVDWKTGQPNARFWVLKLLRDNFGPGDKLVHTGQPNPYVFAQAFIVRDGKRKILLVNKRDRPFTISLPGAAGGELHYVDQTTAFQPPASTRLTGGKIQLSGYAVAVVTL